MDRGDRFSPPKRYDFFNGFSDLEFQMVKGVTDFQWIFSRCVFRVLFGEIL